MNRAAHEVKGPLNGIALNLEVLRTRIEAGKTDQKSLAPFADAAYQEFETAAARTEALLFLGRDGGTSHGDVALTLKHLAQLLIPAAKADGTSLSVEGYDLATESAAPPAAIRLALASGLLALIKEGGGKCLLTANKAPDDTADATAVETVVRFSHQSATAVDLDPEVTSALQQHGIKARRSPQDLTIVFP